ncbi:MAG TPA: hypothetical protein VGM03_03670 [Phycisphaerae bacterium]
MATVNGSLRTQRHSTTKRARADRFASERLRTRAATKDFQEIGAIARAAQDKLGQFRSNAPGYYEQGRDKIHEVERTAEQFIAERPLKTVLVAVGVGLLLGRFWMRR